MDEIQEHVESHQYESFPETWCYLMMGFLTETALLWEVTTLSVQSFNVALWSKDVGEVESKEHAMWNSLKAGVQLG